MPKTKRLLASGGAEFANAYATTPLCCPSRSSILTGLYAHNHKVLTNGDRCGSDSWRSEFEDRTFAAALSRSGYRTGESFFPCNLVVF